MNAAPRASILEKIPVAVSACLLGERVRYDGRDRRFPLLLERLREAGLKALPVCPEVGAGLSVPRPPVELVRTGHDIRALGVEDRKLDVTEKIRAFARRFLKQHRFFGFIGKGKSPSCGLRVILHRFEGGELAETAEGIFVQTLKERGLDVPLIEAEAIVREECWRRFVEEVFRRARNARFSRPDPRSAPPGR